MLVAILAGLLAIVTSRGDRRPAARPATTPAPTRPSPSLIPEVATFLGSHPEFGIPTSTQDVPDWAKGKRQRVNFDSGRSLLFYEKDGAVTTVYEDDPSEGRKKIWGEYDR